YLHNTHLHAPGVERGTQPYGGNGYGASNYSINGIITAKATLPQREIYEQVARRLRLKSSLRKLQSDNVRFTQVIQKDVHKLLRLKSAEPLQENGGVPSGTIYIDTQALKESGKRYAELEENQAFHLLDRPNAKYIAKLKPLDIEHIRALRTQLV